MIGVIIIKLFSNKKKYVISFEKLHKCIDNIGTVAIITDDCIIRTLYNLKEKYNFDVVSLELKDTFESLIKIQCEKDMKDKIFMEFCMMLSGKITKSKIKRYI